MRTRSYALVLDEEGRRVLLRRGPDGWAIPYHESDEPRWWHVTRELNAAFSEQLGADVTTLRCLGTSADRGLRFYELELHGHLTFEDAVWAERDAIESMDLAEPEHRPTLLRCIDERGIDGDELTVRWARPGWFAEAVGWIREHVGDGANVVQERTWSISTVLRAATPDGTFYFKAVPPVFAAEPVLTNELGRRHPGRAPAVVAVDEERRWMLMRDTGGEPMSSESDRSSLAAAVRVYAELQISWVDRGGELTELGCPDRTLGVLEPQVDALLGRTELFLPGHPEGLSDAEIQAVPPIAEQLHHACERLRAHGLPPTLEHGDLHTDNVREREVGYVFIDWSDACLSVPFFSLVPFLHFHPEPLDPRLVESLRDAYLQPWAKELGRNDLVEAFELAQFVGLFHQAASYHRITEGIEPRARWEFERGFPFFVKRLLRSEQ